MTSRQSYREWSILPFNWHVTVFLHAVQKDAYIAVERFLQHLEDVPDLLRSSGDGVHHHGDVKGGFGRIGGGNFQNRVFITGGSYFKAAFSLWSRYQQIYHFQQRIAAQF